MARSGPLAGLRVVEFAGIGPVPYAVMLLADLGAEVLRIDREGAAWPEIPIVSRGRSHLLLDLKDPAAVATARDAVARADVMVEGFRPGVMERLGLGPDTTLADNPRLIYARMTGWGQEGPLAQRAGHDINYLAISGLLSLLSPDGAPPDAPMNLLGDYAAGSLFMVMGVLAALFERERSGRGQVIDAAIVDGATSLMAPLLGMKMAGLLSFTPRGNLLGGRMPYYRSYRCADGRDLAVGPLEANFQRLLTDRLELAPGTLDGDPQKASELLARVFAGAPRDHWTQLFENSDACVAPVLTIDEAAESPHMRARGTYSGSGSDRAPAPAPRFSRTPGTLAVPLDGESLLAAWRAD